MRNKNTMGKLHMEPRAETLKRRTRLFDAVCDTLHTYVILVMAAVCALWMAEDVFSRIALSTEILVRVFAAVVPLVLIIGVAGECVGRLRLPCRYLPPVIYIAILIRYGMRNSEELLKGLYYISRPVIEQINDYYKTGFMIHAGNADYADTALAFIVLCVCVFFLMEAMWCGRRILLVVMPLLVLAAEMAVGKTPQVRSMVLLFVSILMARMGGWENLAHPAERRVQSGIRQKVLSLLVPAGVIAAILLIGVNAFKEPAVQVAEYGVTVRQMQWDMEANLSSRINVILANMERKDWSHITNLTPHYTDTEVLSVTTNRLPDGNLYLRGYYGVYYENGEWTSQVDEFDELWEAETGGADILLYTGCQENMLSGDGDKYMLRLDYTDLDTTVVYAPQWVLSSGFTEDVTITGDYLVRKEAESSGITYNYMDVDKSLLIWEDANADYADWEVNAWYASYVEDTYLEIPDSLSEAARQIAVEILADNLKLVVEDWDKNWTAGEKTFYATQIIGSDNEWSNEIKYDLASLVADYLSEWTYSLNLSGAPSDTDVVAYFMTESHTGYCIHYATAATMILREMGIPARYATGYLCRVGNATVSGSWEYEISILDSDAHAWVEVYMDGLGWYPIEVTPAAGEESESDATPQSERTAMSESEGGSDAESESDADTESEETDTASEGDSQSNSEREQGESESASQDNSDNQNANGGQENGSSGQTSGSGMSAIIQIVKTAALILGILLLIAGIVRLVVFLCVTLPRRREQMQLEKIRRDIAAGKNRRAIYAIHRMVHRKLRKKTRVAAKRISDREYALLLEKYYPQEEPFAWEKYVEIVQKCVFSKEEVTGEETQYCSKMLERVL